MSINPGDLKQRLIFKQNNAVDDDGYPIPGGLVYAKAWGSLKTLKGNTKFIAAQSQMEHNREFTIRYQKKLLETERPKGLIVLWRKKEHEIESIEDEDGLKIEMLVILKAVT
ncbi:phage head-tail adaptor, putative, SPP1 family [Gracilibacillus orientalis]|uniref:Phage head-tail adaptor, putative, SPP1 family n=1 Tax=Gracilibacillus orientalis TaxID=334253 RepID=A0A1I4H9D6_9BACI|nr:phage head closure protein [Gracilibacillus orientalis]SFL38909.1 phage head-tail adaptor, putative, SPP1 family [Gracilibacillus orientalis]